MECMSTYAAIYVRISSDREGREAGIDRQEADCQALAERLGFTVSRVYRENDTGASSKSRKARPLYADMLSRVEAGEFGAVLAYSNSRLTRRPREFEDLIDLHDRYGLRIHTVVSGDDDLSKADGRMVARIKASVDAAEAERISERVQRANADRIAAGLPSWSRRPFGYEMDGTPRETEAEAVRAAYRDVLDGRSIRSIAVEWSGTFPTVTGRDTWNPASVWHLLRNARNAGIRTHKGAEVGRGTWTPLVDEATYRAVVAKMDGRAHKGPRKVSHLLTGIALCGRCDSTVNAGHMTNKRGKTGPYKTYRCADKPGHFHRKLAPVDEIVTRTTLAILVLPEAREFLTESAERPDAEALRAERETLRHRRDVEIPGMVAAGLTVAQIKAANDAVVARLEEIDAALTEDERRAVFAGLFDEFAYGAVSAAESVWASLPLHRQRGVLEAVWASIRVLPGRGAGVDLVPTGTTQRLIDENATDLDSLILGENVQAL